MRGLVLANPLRRTQNEVMNDPSLREIRRLRNMTLQQLASMAGMQVGNLSRVERGMEMPRPRRLQRLADALNLPVTQVYAAIAAAGATPTVEAAAGDPHVE
jgi:transcriptional regulator with XRE-family HTH domain